MSSEITPINKKLAIISGNVDLPYNILESAVSNGWNGVVIDMADNQKLKSQQVLSTANNLDLKEKVCQFSEGVYLVIFTLELLHKYQHHFLKDKKRY